jgi:hypothetical protein
LDAAVDRPVTKVLEGKILFVDLVELVTDCERDSGERLERRVRWKDPALLLSALLGTWNGCIDLLENSVVNEG